MTLVKRATWAMSYKCYLASLQYPDELYPLSLKAYDLAALDGRVLAATDGDTLRGWALYEVRDQIFWITHLARYRGETAPGIGSLLMRALLYEAQDKGFPVVMLGVRDTNTHARAFYERWGFIEMSKIIHQDIAYIVVARGNGAPEWQNIASNFVDRLL